MNRATEHAVKMNALEERMGEVAVPAPAMPGQRGSWGDTITINSPQPTGVIVSVNNARRIMATGSTTNSVNTPAQEVWGYVYHGVQAAGNVPDSPGDEAGAQQATLNSPYWLFDPVANPTTGVPNADCNANGTAADTLVVWATWNNGTSWTKVLQYFNGRCV